MNGTLVGLSIILLIGVVGMAYGLYCDFSFASKMNTIKSEEEMRIER